MTSVHDPIALPTTVAEGKRLLRDLERAIYEIEAQIEAGHIPLRDGTPITDEAFRIWRFRARLALSHKRYDRDLVAEWLAQHEIGPDDLLLACRRALSAEVRTPEDQTLVVAIDGYLQEQGTARNA